MELEELYKELKKAYKDGKLKGIMLVAPSENEVQNMLMGSKKEVMAGLMVQMYENKDTENLIKYCAKIFRVYKKEMDKKFK